MQTGCESKKLIQIENLVFSYGEKVVFHNFSYAFHKGTSYALLGRSGCGKSTLLHLIAGERKPNEGKIIRHKDILPLHQGKIGFLYQNLALFPWQTTEEAVQMPLHILKKNNKNEVEGLLTELGIWDKRNYYPKDLSGGEKQRVALARTLITKPNLLLMDEPTSALDQMTKETLQQLMFKEQNKYKYTLLFVTHDIEEAVFLGEKILVMQEQGNVEEVKNPYFGLPDAKEQLPYYEFCILLRKKLGAKEIPYET